jgi:hypothetical protein
LIGALSGVDKIFHTWIFFGLFLLLGINIFACIKNKFEYFEAKDFTFILIHGGILLIITGFLITESSKKIQFFTIKEGQSIRFSDLDFSICFKRADFQKALGPFSLSSTKFNLKLEDNNSLKEVAISQDRSCSFRGWRLCVADYGKSIYPERVELRCKNKLNHKEHVFKIEGRGTFTLPHTDYNLKIKEVLFLSPKIQSAKRLEDVALKIEVYKGNKQIKNIICVSKVSKWKLEEKSSFADWEVELEDAKIPVWLGIKAVRDYGTYPFFAGVFSLLIGLGIWTIQERRGLKF